MFYHSLLIYWALAPDLVLAWVTHIRCVNDRECWLVLVGGETRDTPMTPTLRPGSTSWSHLRRCTGRVSVYIGELGWFVFWLQGTGAIHSATGTGMTRPTVQNHPSLRWRGSHCSVQVPARISNPRWSESWWWHWLPRPRRKKGRLGKGDTVHSTAYSALSIHLVPCRTIVSCFRLKQNIKRKYKYQNIKFSLFFRQYCIYHVGCWKDQHSEW